MKPYKKKTIIQRGDGFQYLIRYTLFNCRWFSLKVHKILSSDDDCMHDHPWAFITFLLKGGYVEHNNNGSKVYGRFSLLYRSAKYTHRLEIHQPVWSVVITFKKVRQWGFHTKHGWVPWFRYSSKNHCD